MSNCGGEVLHRPKRDAGRPKRDAGRRPRDLHAQAKPGAPGDQSAGGVAQGRAGVDWRVGARGRARLALGQALSADCRFDQTGDHAIPMQIQHGAISACHARLRTSPIRRSRQLYGHASAKRLRTSRGRVAYGSSAPRAALPHLVQMSGLPYAHLAAFGRLVWRSMKTWTHCY